MIRRIVLAVLLVVPPLSAGTGVWTTTYPDGASIGAARLVLDTSSPSILYAAPNWRGVYTSTDGAATWSNLTDGIGGPEVDEFRAAISGLTHDPAAGRLYVVGNGKVFRSSDGGATWTELSNGLTGWVRLLVVDPSNSAVLYAGTDDAGLFKTLDGGANWASIGSASLPVDAIEALVVDPVTPTTVYLGTSANGVHRSSDGGATWLPAGAGPSNLETLLVDPAAPATVFAAASDGTAGGGIYRSTDGTLSWSKLPPVLNFGWESGRVLAFDPTNSSILYAVGNNDIHRSVDGGNTWAATTVTVDQLATVVVDPSVPSTVYVGAYNRGIFKSTDSGATWSQSHSGVRGLNFPHSAHHSLAVDASDPTKVYGGSIDGGRRSLDAGATWSALGYPEGTARAIATHPGAAGTVYAVHNDLWRSTDSGATWSDPSGGAFGGFQQGDLVVDPGDPLTLYVAARNDPVADGVYKSTDGGATFALASTGLTNPTIHCLGIDPNNGNTLYAGTVHGSGPASGLYKTTDGGTSWFQLGGGLPAEFNPNAIVVHPADSNVVFLGSETVNGGVYRSGDGGSSWTKVMDENVNSLAVDPGDTNRLYVGTWNTGGFYRSLDGGGTWARINAGLPVNPGIESVVVDPANSSRLLIGTTAGVYEYTFTASSTLSVNNAGDSGPGSLRDALEQANQDGMPTVIAFDPSMAGASIQLLSQPPSLNEDNTTLDGDLDGDCVPDVEINGELTCCEGFQVNSSDNLVRGLAINRFAFGNAIAVQGAGADGNAIECNYLGTDLSGTIALSNAVGVHLVGGATNTRVGGDPVTQGNLISGNLVGLHLLDSSGNNIEGNRIGTAANGVDPLGNNNGFNVGVPSSGSVIGPDNIIAFNSGNGVYIADGVDWVYPDFAGYSGDPILVFPVIEFTDDGGTTPFHSADGITPVDSNGNTFHEGFGARFTGTLTVGAAGAYTFDLEHDDAVRLTVGAAELFEGGCCGGTSVGSTLSMGSHPIRVDFMEGGGHARLGLVVTGPGSADLTTDGNTGGCAAAQPGLCGEFFQLRIPSDFNTITQNSIHDNGALGINLESGGDDQGVTANDTGDIDIGPNTLLNFPEFDPGSIADLGGGLYDLAGTAPPDSLVEIFAGGVDPSGHGEGKEYLATFVADASGLFTGVIVLPPGYFAVTATATDLAGNTSEFAYRAVLQPNVLTVTNVSDGGPGSLRDAVDQANADGVTTIIDLDPGLAGGTIQLLSELPALTDSETTIDGDLDDDCLPDVALDGSMSGGTGLQIFSSSNLVQGLAIHSFGSEGVTITPGALPADDNVLECNFIGTDLSGTAAMPNGNAGLSIHSGATNNRIGGPVASARNVISGNQWAGVHLGGVQGNTVEGNFIGTDVTGTAPLGNQSEGIHIGGTSGANQIGPGNVISASQWVGIYLSDTNGTVVEGNFIGTDVTGSINLGNQAEGILVDGATLTNRFGPGNVIAFNSIGVAMQDTLSPNWGDFSSGPADYLDVFPLIDLSAVDQCSRVENSDGIIPLDGGGGGFIEFFATRFSGTLNVDTSGDYTFEFLDLNNGVNLVVDGNEILNQCCGTVSTNTFLNAGDHSFELQHYVYTGPGRLKLDITGPGTASLATDGNVGGCSAGQAGLCAEFYQRRAFALGNTVTQNSIFDNQNIGIDLQTCGQWGQVTPNDPGDGDEGPNTLLNFPELTGSTDLGGGSFTVDGTAPPDSTVEISAADPDPSGHGEGRDYLDTTVADPSGNFSITVVLPAGAYAVTATATDAAGNTSEFSANLVLRPNALTVGNANDSGPGSLREALEEAGFDGADTIITFDPALAGQTIHLLDQLPGLTEDNTVLDGDFNGDCVPDIQLDGSVSGSWTGLEIQSSNNLVRGLVISNFTNGNGIYIASVGVGVANGNVIECNYIGTELDGVTPAGNGQSGLVIEGDAHDNRVGPDNVIAFNNHDGVAAWGAHRNTYPEFGGLAPDYIDIFPILNFNDDSGVFESVDGIIPTDGGGAPFTDNFGARFTGTLNVDTAGDYTFDLPNLDDNARIVVDGEGIIDACCGDNSVNWSLSAGDHTFEVDYWQWGPPAHLQVLISGPGTASLGTDGNAAGCAAGQVGLCGEFFQQVFLTPDRNLFTENSIFANNEIGIDHGGDDVTPNDPGDGDGGSNTQLNFPELTGFNDLGGGTYDVTGTAPPDSTVELFGSDEDPSGHGEGKAFLGSTVVDPSGNLIATVNLPVDLFAVTATATDLAGNTSEFAQNLRVKSPDSVTVGTATILQGDTGEVPIYVRDLAATPLGVDQPPGSRIQGFTFQVEYSPAASVSAISVARAGIAAGLTPIFETSPVSGNTITYLVLYDESTNQIPFTLDGAAPGDHVASLSVTIDPLAPPTPIQLILLGSGTLLSNQGGTREENQSDGTLELFGGSVTVASRSATALYAAAQSPSEVQLTWIDPQAGETGFRVERSPDGSSWSPVTTLGPDDTAYLDGGLNPMTLFFYRVISFSGGGDNQPSNTAAAETFPLSAAKTCVTQVSEDRTWARMPDIAWNGTNWATVYMERTNSTNDELFFQFLHPDGSPAGSPVRLTQNDMLSQFPSIYWNGTNFGVIWSQHMRGANGEITSNTYFALIDANGQILRNGVRLVDPTTMGQLNNDIVWSLVWDGGGWGLFQGEAFNEPWTDVTYWRFSEDGEMILGPAQVTNSPDREHDIKAAWNGAEYGVAWIRETGPTHEILFQRLLTDGSQPVGDPGPVQLWQNAPGEETWYTDVVWNGAGWAVTWMVADPVADDEAIYLRLLDVDGTPLGPAQRISDDFDTTFPPDWEFPVFDEVPELFAKPGGGYVIFTSSFVFANDFSFSGWEIARLEADAGGNRVGQRKVVSDFDGNPSLFQRSATNGSDHLVVYGENRQGSMETASVLVDPGGNVINGPHDLTCCHSSGNPALFRTAGGAVLLPFQGGFISLWNDEVPSGSWQTYGQIFDGTGAPTTAIYPLSGRDNRGRVGAVAVGDTFAVAWKDGNDNLVFDRYDAGGASLLGDTDLATGAGGPPNVTMAHSGEHYGVAYYNGNEITLRRVDSAGAAVGGPIVVSDLRGGSIELQWTGAGWALVWRSNSDSNLYYALVDAWGSLTVPATQLTLTGGPNNNYDLLWTGARLGVTWVEDRSVDPPGNEHYFTEINPDGSLAYPEVEVANPHWASFRSGLLYWKGDRFALVRSGGDGTMTGGAGMVEDEILPGGAVLPNVRRIANRGRPDALAFNGVTFAVMWGQMRELFFQTDACLDDVSAPVCPDVTISSDDQAVHLAWPAVDDPESGIYRYNVYRDGFMLAEQFPTSLAFDDEGFHPEQVNTYEVRALNGAYLESAACPVLTWSLMTGDANGDGVLTVLDVFYLINSFFAGGPAPMGDADANGDGSVTIADIFYLINFFFGGGPPPAAPVAATAPVSASHDTGEAPLVDLTSLAPTADEVRMPAMSALPQALIEIPIYVRDLSGTLLGMDQPAGQRIQGLSISVVYSPASAVDSIAFARAGLTEGLTPMFETTVQVGNRISWIASFDEVASPLGFDLDRAEPGDLVAKLVARVDAAAIAGSILDLTFDADTTIVSNQSGTMGETVANGLLLLGASAVQIIDCTTPGDVALPNQTIDFTLVCEAGGSITAGPFLRIVPPADVTLRAGESVLFEDGFTAASKLEVVNDPSL
ncbi:MAG: PA14 domain-containing protein [Thermoanaerobaculia bacterium]